MAGVCRIISVLRLVEQRKMQGFLFAQEFHPQKKYIVRMHLIPICAYPARVWHDHVIVALSGGVFYLSDCTRPLCHGKGKRSNACMAIYFLRRASG